MMDNNATKSQQLATVMTLQGIIPNYTREGITSKNINLNPDNVHKYGGDK